MRRLLAFVLALPLLVPGLVETGARASSERKAPNQSTGPARHPWALGNRVDDVSACWERMFPGAFAQRDHRMPCAERGPERSATDGDAVPSGPAQGSDWSIVPSPNAGEVHATNARLADVTCVSASNCWAVGSSAISGFTTTLIQRWNGTAWTIVPFPHAGSPSHLNGVTCVSASDCWAVGSKGSNTLIGRWNGATWAIVPAPNAFLGQTVQDIACASATDCWAVGWVSDWGYRVSLILHWDGSSWKFDSALSTAFGDRLTAVACPSPLDCWAAGYRLSESGGSETLFIRWNGVKWAEFPLKDLPPPGEEARIAGVTCMSPIDCWAVGSTGSGSGGVLLIERWNGIAWMVVPSPIAGELGALTDVTCVSASNCWAVGSSGPSPSERTLVAWWNGASWTIVPSPNPSGDDVLNGVACASATACWTAGYDQAGRSLIERWDGASWTIEASPNVEASLPATNVLVDVACLSISDCWAVGYFWGSAPDASRTLIQHWDGTGWSIVSSPNAGDSRRDNFLVAVSCASRSNCWAVGYEGARPLIERWDGTVWTIVASPDPGYFSDTEGYNLLTDVTCVSASDCWAVGYYEREGSWYDFRTLIEHWDGNSWEVVPSPNPSEWWFSGFLEGVTCLSASDCWAVGWSDGWFEGRTLIEHWNGSSWSIVPAEDPGYFNDLFDVTCLSASDCWTVGTYLDDAYYRILIEHWNGTAWTRVPSPHAGNGYQDEILAGVACVSGSDCWNVGATWSGKTILMRWDGSSWTSAPAPDPPGAEGLYSVTCVAASDCWGVGAGNVDSIGGPRAQTLTERYAPASS